MQKRFWLALSMASTATFVAVPIGVFWNVAMSFSLRLDYFQIGMCFDGSEMITGDSLFFLVWLVPLIMFPVSLWSGIRAFRTNKLIFLGVGIGLSVMGGAISGLVGGTVLATQVFLPLEMQRVCECKENRHHDRARSAACDFVRKRKK